MATQISPDTLRFLTHKALMLRIDSIRATTAAKSGHATSALSAADIISALFFDIMHFDPKNPKHPDNDRFILSKGHSIPVVYAAWKQVGVITDEELMAYRKFDSELEGHPTPRFAYNEAATGSLGQGLSVGAGMALAAKMDGRDYTTYVLLGDGEIAEGSVWEASELAAHRKLDNLIGIIDMNRLGQSEETLHAHEANRYAEKFTAFGWHTQVIDGHNIEEIVNAIAQAQSASDKPSMIIAKTFKGHGVQSVADKNGFHGKPLKEEEAKAAIEELKTTFKEASEYGEETKFTPKLPKESGKPLKKSTNVSYDLDSDPNRKLFGKGSSLATRKAFGYGLAALGRVNEEVVVLDGDVKNSTFTNIFEKEFPDRFVQCYIAEQNMIGMATGFELRGKMPFAATFACFLTRPYDQIRMAGIGRNALRLSGSHCGVSIGADGPSQMGLEDIALMRAIPNSVVLYPSDAVSAYKLVAEMANYNDGISYIRTTRSDTPIIYDTHEPFSIGGCKVVKQNNDNKCLIIAAGITLHEALAAHQELEKEGIIVSVIDLYSIKPLDVETVKKVAKASGNKVITVEDHYAPGGMGEAVTHALKNTDIHIETLCVDKLARSGTPEELLAFEGIDRASIIETVKKIIRL